jgi:hypothetical protein
MENSTDRFTRELTRQHRVVVLGGLAVIAHGFSRSTYDADIWLEPMSSAEAWAEIIIQACGKVPGTSIHRLPGWSDVSGEQVAVAAVETGLVRVLGLNYPLDIFRRPNEFLEGHFDEVALRASRNGDGTLLPSPLDLIQSKLGTNREKDGQDILFLESLVRADYKRRLPQASLEEAEKMLGEYSEWQVLRAALENPLTEVQELARKHLREFAATGDPFSQAILEGREIP